MAVAELREAHIKRRDFISSALLGGVAAASPLRVRAQLQTDRMQRVGVLMGWTENDPEFQRRLAALVQGLAQLGWTEGRNLRIDIRWTNGDVDRARTLAKELVELQPDVIVAGTTPVTAALHRATHTIPIVFTVVADPVGAGFVASLARPGANITGFLTNEGAMGGKWLGLLKQCVPRLERVAIMFNPDTAPGGGSFFLDSFDAAARSLGVRPSAASVRSDAEIETAITTLGREQAGLVVTTDSFLSIRRSVIIAAATSAQVPTIADAPFYGREGCLISYGADNEDLFRRAAVHVDRILHGAKPGDLPVEVPTKFYFVINVKAAKALDLTVPPSLLATADEVIE
jgi:putative tryptophan/tyrosine transport system substrate-binding protein